MSCGRNSTTSTACHNGNTMLKMNVPAILYSVTSGGTSSWVPNAAIDGSLASSSSLQWCASLLLNGRHCKPCADVVATIVLVSSPMSRWRRRLRCTCVAADLAASPSCCHQLRCMTDIANVVRAQLPSSRWHLCQRCHHKGVVAIIALTLSSVALASTPSYRHHRQRCAGSVAVLTQSSHLCLC